MRLSLPAFFLIASMQAHAQPQDVEWLRSWPMDYVLNPQTPDQALASAPGRLASMRTTSVAMIYGQEAYGQVALEALDPVTGSVLMACYLGDSVAVEAVAVEASGIAYYCGRFMGDALPLCDGSILSGIGGFLTENFFLLAMDLDNGLILWARNINVDHPDVLQVPSLDIDPDGNLWYLLTEFSSGTAIRVDANGDDVGSRVITGTRRFGTLSFDPWGGLYVSGSCENGAVSFGGQNFPVSSAQGYNMFVLRFQPDGNAGFAEFADDVTFQNPTVAATSDGRAYLAGDLLDSTNWGGIAFHGPNWVYDVFIAALDSTGQFLWGNESAPDSGSITGDMYRAKGPCVAVDPDLNQACLMGNLRGQVDWGGGVVSNGLTLGAQTMSIVVFAPDGEAWWTATSQPVGTFQQAQTLTARAEVGTLHFAGHVWGDFVFSPDSTNLGGGQAAMVGRMNAISTGLDGASAAPEISYWPNPTGDVLHVEVKGHVAQPVDLLNIAGQRVLGSTLWPGTNTLDISDLAAGLYLMRIADEAPVRLVKH